MVKRNKYGFYSLKNIPTQKELMEYYSKKYYQENNSTYENVYSEEELQYIHNKIEQKYYLFKNLIRQKENVSLLDVGCGEGFSLSFFNEKKWNVLGLDFSIKGLQNHNPDLLDKIISGDIFENINSLKKQAKRFDVIWLDNVLEHVIDSYKLLKDCFELANEKGILIIEVPNDFSMLQMELRKQNIINKDFWVVVPDHISYFNKQGLINICSDTKWEKEVVVSDFPIDINLFNPNSNYYEDKTKGKGSHLQRVKIENLFHNTSIEKTNKLYESMADLGLGRQIIGVFKK